MRKKTFIIVIFGCILVCLILFTSFFIPKVVADRNFQYGSLDYEKVVEYQFRVIELIKNEGELEILDYRLNGREHDEFTNPYIEIEVLDSKLFNYDKYVNHIYNILGEKFPLNINPKPHKYEVLIHGIIRTIDEIENKILVESIEDSPFYEHPFSCWVSIGVFTTIRDKEYVMKSISDINLDTKVSVYTKYMILESKPLKASGDLIIISNE